MHRRLAGLIPAARSRAAHGCRLAVRMAVGYRVVLAGRRCGCGMGFEIERKFLLCGDGWQSLASGRSSIRQAYLSSAGKASVRVRIKDDVLATLTIKSRAAGLRRLELEYSIPVTDAEALLELRDGAVIEKVRHIVQCGGATWEVDVFGSENTGLVIAEIELQSAHQDVALPDWIGTEVTGQAQYYNNALAQRPYRMWS